MTYHYLIASYFLCLVVVLVSYFPLLSPLSLGGGGGDVGTSLVDGFVLGRIVFWGGGPFNDS
tara:strand:+ start:4556 stop:4741 length:186 start_codon:yes stop_codon:yes gene_type:complete